MLHMGVYLNSKGVYGLFKEEAEATYYVDKSSVLCNLVPIIESPENRIDAMGRGQKYICITRPRRFGKTTMANMIASYFGRGADGRETFDHLAIAKEPWFEDHSSRTCGCGRKEFCSTAVSSCSHYLCSREEQRNWSVGAVCKVVLDGRFNY